MPKISVEILNQNDAQPETAIIDKSHDFYASIRTWEKFYGSTTFCYVNDIKDSSTQRSCFAMENPGKGNCSRYALAIGLIVYLRTSPQDQVNECLEKLKSYYNKILLSSPESWETFQEKIFAFKFNLNQLDELALLKKFNEFFLELLNFSFSKNIKNLVEPIDSSDNNNSVIQQTSIEEKINNFLKISLISDFFNAFNGNEISDTNHTDAAQIIRKYNLRKIQQETCALFQVKNVNISLTHEFCQTKPQDFESNTIYMWLEQKSYYTESHPPYNNRLADATVYFEYDTEKEQ